MTKIQLSKWLNKVGYKDSLDETLKIFKKWGVVLKEVDKLDLIGDKIRVYLKPIKCDLSDID